MQDVNPELVRQDGQVPHHTQLSMATDHSAIDLAALTIMRTVRCFGRLGCHSPYTSIVTTTHVPPCLEPKFTRDKPKCRLPLLPGNKFTHIITKIPTSFRRPIHTIPSQS